MSVRPVRSRVLGPAIPVGALATVSVPVSDVPERGGILDAMRAEDPPGFSIQETATSSGVRLAVQLRADAGGVARQVSGYNTAARPRLEREVR